MAMVSVRYITDDVDATVDFYVERLGFNVELRPPGTGFAMLSRGDLRLLLNEPGAGAAGQPMPDGRRPQPGGWNRIQLEVSDLERQVTALRAAGASFRGEIITGRGGSRSCSTIPPAIPSSSFSPDSERSSNPCHPCRTSSPTFCCAARRFGTVGMGLNSFQSPG